MAVMPIDSPGSQNPFHVAIVSRTPDMVHYLIPTVLYNCGANLASEGVQHFVPRCAFPLTFTAFASTFEWIENALWIIDLVDRRWSFGTVASTASWMIGVALEAFHSSRLFIHICQQTTGCFAIKADSRDNLIMLLNLARPGLCVVLDPV